MAEFKELLARVAEGKALEQADAERAFQVMLNGGATPAQMAAFLTALRRNGESVTDLAAGALVLRAKCKPFHAPEGTVDTCGTGGDGLSTVNISTATAFVVAACGVPVAKHGNHAVSSRSGSADVLSALGINVQVPSQVMERALKELNICFLLAPIYHPGMRHVAPVRQELGFRTIFNILGPLASPAKAKRQLIGVFSGSLVPLVAEALQLIGSEHAWVVHGQDGQDEISVTDETYVAELKNGRIREFHIRPEDYGLSRHTLKDLQGGDAQENARALQRVLSGKKSAYLDSVLLNAAATLLVAGKASKIEEGIALAQKALASDKAINLVEKFAQMTQESEHAA